MTTAKGLKYFKNYSKNNILECEIQNKIVHSKSILWIEEFVTS